MTSPELERNIRSFEQASADYERRRNLPRPPATDRGLIDALRQAGEELRVRASLYAVRADDWDVRDYLDQFARCLDDAMADSLTPATKALDLAEQARDHDPKGRREFLPPQPAKSWE